MKTRTGLLLSFGLFLTISLICAPFVFSQASADKAQLRGTLTDPSGTAVGGFQITAQMEAAHGTRFAAVSSPDGAYSLTVPPGRYEIHFFGNAFSEKEITVNLASGESRILNLELRLEPLSDRVIVTAESLPIVRQQTSARTDVISHEMIELRQAVALPEVLQFTPGVSFGRTGANGGTASLFLDGGNSNFTKVLVDGTPINPPGAAVDFSTLTTDNVAKIEIVHGAESAIYGTDAVSGVVQVFSQRGETRVPSASVFAEGGNYSSGRGGAQVSGLIGGFDYSGAASYLQTDGQGPNDDFLNRTLTGNFGYKFDENDQLRLALRNNSSEAGIPGQTVFTPPSLHQRYDQHLFSANGRWDFTRGKHWQYHVAGTEAYTRQHSFNPEQSFYATDPNASCPKKNPSAVATAEFCDFPYDFRYQYNRAGGEAQASYVTQKFGVTAGYQYEVENASISYLQQGHVRRNNQGGYLNLRYTPISRLSLDFGARAEANGYFGTRVVPRTGGSFALRYGNGFWGDTRYRAFYGEGVKEPRFDQTYGTDPCDPGNLSLKPEASKNWSTGFDQKLVHDRVKLTADYFSSRFYNIVSFTFCAPGGPCPIVPPAGCPFGFGTYFNTDLARARGTHMSSEIRAAKWLFVTGNYTYDDSLIVSSPNAFDPSLVPGNRLARRPLNSGSMSFVGTFGRFNVTLAGYFAGRRTDSDFLGLGLTRDPGYARFDLAASYHLGRGMILYAHAFNLFDKRYQDALGYPALGRDVRVGMRYTFAGRN